MKIFKKLITFKCFIKEVLNWNYFFKNWKCVEMILGAVAFLSSQALAGLPIFAFAPLVQM